MAPIALFMSMGAVHPESGSIKTLTASAFREYAEVLSRYLLRRVRRREDAEDLSQEIFELFLRKRDHSDTIRDPLSYLFRIAFHVVGDALRREKRDPVTFDSTLLDTSSQVDAGAGNTSLEDRLVLKDEIARALATLPQNHLTALTLVEGQGMSHKEAAAIMGLSPNSITIYVSHARAALKLALDVEQSRKSSRR
jgi:RNA polymerase sigma factor (sigma-70 family)